MPGSASLLYRCGPVGWKHAHWDGCVYPRPRPGGFDPLEFLAERFETVEVDSTSGGAPAPELTRLWVRKVSGNRNFRFTFRIPSVLAADRRLDGALLAGFRRSMGLVLEQGRLGCLVLRFPSEFRFHAENRDFFIRLRRALHGFPLVAEMSHASWMTEEALGVLIDYHVGFANIDPPPSLRAAPSRAVLTSPTGYVKLYGGRHGAGGGDYLYSTAELEEWKLRIEQLGRFAESVYVVTANSLRGRSVVNALQLRGLLAGSARRGDDETAGGRQERLLQAEARGGGGRAVA